ncbi:hypothetical protein F2Q68_00015682 [Brassica cretica]|uniref:Uncharacterized protein n=1 Tax=Brassica cretica TaxID=69181 RepID=A0A8S9HJK3_BRACR|nr:hypothetical protein F2Q68_00015682 [Brassica cretica]
MDGFVMQCPSGGFSLISSEAMSPLHGRSMLFLSRSVVSFVKYPVSLLVSPFTTLWVEDFEFGAGFFTIVPIPESTLMGKSKCFILEVEDSKTEC